mgnify:FL=1
MEVALYLAFYRRLLPRMDISITIAMNIFANHGQLQYDWHNEGDQISNVSMLLFDLFKEMKLNKLIKTDGRI